MDSNRHTHSSNSHSRHTHSNRHTHSSSSHSRHLDSNPHTHSSSHNPHTHSSSHNPHTDSNPHTHSGSNHSRHMDSSRHIKRVPAPLNSSLPTAVEGGRGFPKIHMERLQTMLRADHAAEQPHRSECFTIVRTLATQPILRTRALLCWPWIVKAR
jgi:hypothetical protein